MPAAQEEDLEQARARWRGAVAGVLAKGGRGAGGDGEPERALDTPTYEGFAVRALYTGLDARPEAPLPGRWPFVRGADARRDYYVLELSTGQKAWAFAPPGEQGGWMLQGWFA